MGNNRTDKGNKGEEDVPQKKPAGDDEEVRGFQKNYNFINNSLSR